MDKMGTTKSITETFFSLQYKIPSDFLVLVLSVLCKIHFLFVDQNRSDFCVLIFVQNNIANISLILMLYLWILFDFQHHFIICD